MKVCIIDGGIDYHKMFTKLGYEVVAKVKEADVVCFTGGSDVSPALYGEQPHPATWSNTHRDEAEKAIFDICKRKGIPMVGICRGGQFLHVMNGGRLYQDVDNHANGRPHTAVDLHTKSIVTVTSTHHQMMRLSDNQDGLIVATADESVRKEFVQGDEVVTMLATNVDIEVMWHKDTKCLCFQPHPEFNWAIAGAESTYLYFENLLARYIGGIYEG